MVTQSFSRSSPDDGLGVADALIGAPQAARLSAIARAIPDVGDVFGFECRLAAGAATVDLGIGVRRRADPDARDPGAQLDRDPWGRLRSFLTAWTVEGSELHAWISCLYLEIDAEIPYGVIPIPSIFVSFDEPLAAPPESLRGFQVARAALERILGHPLPISVADRLRSCFTSLPVSGHVLHLGAMLGRPKSDVRLSVALPRCEMQSYLTAIGWPEAPALVDATLALFAADAPTVHLEFDVTDVEGSKLGMVLAPRHAAEWNRLLRRLEAERLCGPEKRTALLTWPGDLASANGYVMRRSLSHVKIIQANGTPREAKAYLTASPVPHRAPELMRRRGTPAHERPASAPDRG